VASALLAGRGRLMGIGLAAVEVETNITVPVSSDKGLCGGINSTVSKYARGTLKTFSEGASSGFLADLCIGYVHL
jgi:F0F1-type ATP synthase gamma subunit